MYIKVYKHKEYVSALCFHPEMNNLFLSGGFKSGVACWDINSNRFYIYVFMKIEKHFFSVVSQYNGIFGQVQSLEFINDGKQFITSSDITKKNSTDKAIIVWDFESVIEIIFY